MWRQLQRKFCTGGPERSSRRKVLSAIIVGCMAGSLGSVVGMGGAFITIPILVHPMFGLSQRVAQGTSMASVLATATGGAIGYMSSSSSSSSINASRSDFIGNISIPTTILVSLASTVTAILGAKFSTKISNRQLKISLAVFMLSVAPSPLLREYLANMTTQTKPMSTNWMNELWKSLSIGTCSGFLAGLYGVGGGAVVVPALCLFTDLTYKESIGTSLAIMLPTAVAGSLQHYRQGTMVRNVAFPLGMGCFIGSLVGGSLVTHGIDKTNEKKLKYCFTVVMAGLGLKALRDGLRCIK